MSERFHDGRPWFSIRRPPLAVFTMKRVILASLTSGMLFGILERWNNNESWLTAFGLTLVWFILCAGILLLARLRAVRATGR
jgi:hypothetical protein